MAGLRHLRSPVSWANGAGRGPRGIPWTLPAASTRIQGLGANPLRFFRLDPHNEVSSPSSRQALESSLGGDDAGERGRNEREFAPRFNLMDNRLWYPQGKHTVETAKAFISERNPLAVGLLAARGEEMLLCCPGHQWH